MIALDTAAIRAEARAEYEKALEEVNRLKAELARFETEDIPAYSRWFRETFGELLAKMHQLQLRLKRAHLILEMVQRAYLSGGFDTLAQAYHAIVTEIDRRLQEPEANQETSSRSAPGDDFGGEDHSTNGENFRSEFYAPDAEKPRIDPSRLKRVKELYRKIVRILHPDTSKNNTPGEVEMWHQARVAYENGDVETLEKILNLCQINKPGINGTTLSLLREVTEKYQHLAYELKKQVEQSKRDPAWKFAQCTNPDRIYEVTKAHLVEDHLRLEIEVEQTERFFELWKYLESPPVRKRRRRSFSN